MIDKAEIDRKALELGVHPANVQRDYVFGWLLAGLYRPENPLGHQLILKGGNAFRKAYFEHARFSNDLDFSTQFELDEAVLRESVKQACEFATQRSGVKLLPNDTRIGVRSLTEEESKLYEARVYFKSFYGTEDLVLKAELDIKEFDQLFLPVQRRRVIHAYSDASLCQAEIRCLKLEELLAAKLKALLLRRHSPDLYDFVYSVFFQKVLDVRRLEIVTTFLKKTLFEPGPEEAKSLLLALPFQLIRQLWDEYLVCPKLSVFTFDDAERWFRTAVGDLFTLLEPQYAAVGSVGAYRLSFFPAAQRDIIMEAGRLQRVLQLVYQGLERLVEPYALAYKRPKGSSAREYFYAWSLSGGRSGGPGIRSFVAEKLDAIEMTDATFEPRYPIELIKGGAYFAQAFSSKPAAHIMPRRRRITSSPAWMTYTVVCPYCGKRFKRNKLDTRLNKHKDRFGNRCFGRIGTIA